MPLRNALVAAIGLTTLGCVNQAQTPETAYADNTPIASTTSPTSTAVDVCLRGVSIAIPQAKAEACIPVAQQCQSIANEKNTKGLLDQRADIAQERFENDFFMAHSCSDEAFLAKVCNDVKDDLPKRPFVEAVCSAKEGELSKACRDFGDIKSDKMRAEIKELSMTPEIVRFDTCKTALEQCSGVDVVESSLAHCEE